MILTDFHLDFENVKWKHVAQKPDAKKKSWSC